MTKVKAKQRKERLRPTDKLDCLYRAAQEYIESQGGSIVVAGPVSIMRFPGDRKLKWTLSIACVGSPPSGDSNARG